MGMPPNPQSAEKLLTAVYPELRMIARRLLSGERAGHTLQPTALVHEGLLRLFGARPSADLSPQSLLALAAGQMRRVLIDYGRKHHSMKRGGEFRRVPLFDIHPGSAIDQDELLTLNEALELLGQMDPRALAVVELKFFAGCTNDETAAILGVSDGTIEAVWLHARLWLYRELTTPAGS
jgi:RNA polymerase sigma-70 factor, ECF subfamily